MVVADDCEFPDRLFYDLENQIWYEPLDGGAVRTGFTLWASKLMGDVLVFTPKRVGRDFERDRSFAVVEGGKWVGAARAAFDGIVLSQNELLIRKPELLNEDPFGQGWMLTVKPATPDWHHGLVTGDTILPAFEAWLAAGTYKGRAG